MKPDETMKFLYRQESFPILQNRVYDTHREAIECPNADIDLVEDLRTGLVYNAAFKPELVSYDSSYNNEQGLSVRFREHLEDVAHLVEKHMGRQGLVEVGCGKGFFLEMLLARGFDVTGFDPTYEGSNERVVKQYFGPDVMRRGNGLILRHVLEHIQNPVDFLHRLKDANGGRGKVYIEVPCFDWICARKAWFDIYHEHVNYFRLNDFHRIFERVFESGRIFGGQYLYVVADISTVRYPVIDPGDRVCFPEDFTDNLVERRGEERRPTAIWGGASKGVIFSLLRTRAGHPVDMVIDINPAKQGKYLPVTGLRVVSPGSAMQILEPGSTIYVMNSNYFDEIRTITGNRYKLIGIDHE